VSLRKSNMMAPSSNSHTYAWALKKHVGVVAGSAHRSVAAWVDWGDGVLICVGLTWRSVCSKTANRRLLKDLAYIPINRVINERGTQRYFLGLFRHFSKFDNHVMTPAECD
jgi:hypothetical protein